MTPEEVVCAKLKARTQLTALVGQRIYPQANTMEAVLPFCTYARQSIEKQPKLNATSKTQKVLVEVVTYAETEAALHAPATEVVNALNGVSDRPNKVQGMFHVDSDGEQLEDGTRYMRHVFAVWHTEA